MDVNEAIKRLKQETIPNTYNTDFDKDKCIECIESYIKTLLFINEEYKNLGQIETTLELLEENEKLKKAFNKACLMLTTCCPVEQDLIDDLDCENCNDNYKECWKKYLLNEVLKDYE